MKEKIKVTKLSANKGLFVDPKIANRLFQGEFFCTVLKAKSMLEFCF